jgi:hypothetical protein
MFVAFANLNRARSRLIEELSSVLREKHSHAAVQSLDVISELRSDYLLDEFVKSDKLDEVQAVRQAKADCRRVNRVYLRTLCSLMLVLLMGLGLVVIVALVAVR